MVVNAALTLRFLVELGLLAGVAVLAWSLVPDGWRLPTAILAVVVIAAVWGLFLSPKAAVPLPATAAVGLEAVLFFGVGAGLLGFGFGVPAAIGVGLWLLDRIALAVLPGSQPPA